MESAASSFSGHSVPFINGEYASEHDISLSAFFELSNALLHLRSLLSSCLPIQKTGVVGARRGWRYWCSIVADLWRRRRAIAVSQSWRFGR